MPLELRNKPEQVRETLKLEVGRTYLDGNGSAVKIDKVRYVGTKHEYFVSKNRRLYFPDGRRRNVFREWNSSKLDLVSLEKNPLTNPPFIPVYSSNSLLVVNVDVQNSLLNVSKTVNEIHLDLKDRTQPLKIIVHLNDQLVEISTLIVPTEKK